jgi:hypothetical protein
MKGLPSVLDSELLRPLATLALPGAVSLATLYAALLQRSPVFWNYTDTHMAQTGVTLLLAVLFMGLVCEGIGARLETAMDRSLTRRHGHESFTAERSEFLRLAFKATPIGQAYLETLVLRLRFELGNCVACAFCALGSLGLLLPLWMQFTGATLILIAGLWLWIEARSTHLTLANLRRELLKGVIVKEIAEPRIN